MTVTARLALNTDRDEFSAMVYEYLTELRALGSEVIPSERTLDFWDHLFELYTTDLPGMGAVAIAVDALDHENQIGFSIAGAPDLTTNVDTDFGSIAIGHGTYVRPAYRGRRVSTQLRDLVRATLKSQGFETIIGGVHLSNEGGAASLRHTDFTFYQLIGYERL